MHYHEKPWMRAVNAFSEFVLIIIAYLIAGILRAIVPWGNPFILSVVGRYFSIAVIYAVVIVLCYMASGAYLTLHHGSFIKGAFSVSVVNLGGFVLVAALMFVFRISQFSRLLLGFFYVMSVGLIVIKRHVFHLIGRAYVRRHRTQARVAVVANGTGKLAKRFIEKVIPKYHEEMTYVGYFAAEPIDGMDNFLGFEKEFYDVLVNRDIDMIVVAQDVQNIKFLQYITNVAEGYKIRSCVIPVFNDLINAKSPVSSFGGISLVDLKMMPTCEIMGVNIAVTDMAKTVDMITDNINEWRGRYICVSNVHTTVTASEDDEYKEIQNEAVMALPDGGPLSKFSREQGFANAERVTGPDLMKEILQVSGKHGWRHFFYGSTQETLDMLKEKLDERYPGAVVAGMYSPPFRSLTPQEDADIVEMINEAKPDFVWVGLGAPKQERWMAAHKKRVQALMIGVGAAFDYEAGNIKRAPQWMQKCSLEWLYRLFQDPKRLFKRYFDTNIKYLAWKWRRK